MDREQDSLTDSCVQVINCYEMHNTELSDSRGRRAVDELRSLDFDDLYLLRHLLGGRTITSTSAEMGLTQPAVTRRLRKLERVIGGPIVEKLGRRARLTAEGLALCEKARAALSVMEGLGAGPASWVVNLGTRPETGMSWLWPALARLRKKRPEQVYHLHFGSGEEVLRMLGGGMLDAVLTSAPHAVKGHGSIEVAREDYVFAAAPRLAARVRRLEDLRKEVLIEHDRSFPFLRYVEAGERAAMKCKDVWFVGSTNAMASALIQGMGVGILPRYLARPALRSGKLERILPEVKLSEDYFRLVYRLDRDLESAVRILGDALARFRLR